MRAKGENHVREALQAQREQDDSLDRAVAYTLLKLVTGRLKDSSPLIYVFAGLFLIFFIARYVIPMHTQW